MLHIGGEIWVIRYMDWKQQPNLEWWKYDGRLSGCCRIGLYDWRLVTRAELKIIMHRYGWMFVSPMNRRIDTSGVDPTLLLSMPNPWYREDNHDTDHKGI